MVGRRGEHVEQRLQVLRVGQLAVGGAVFVAVAGLGAYGLARAALSPVERLRQQVAAVSGRVDFIACKGRGLCAEALPELITLDDWGFPIVSARDVPSRLLGDARATEMGQRGELNLGQLMRERHGEDALLVVATETAPGHVASRFDRLAGVAASVGMVGLRPSGKALKPDEKAWRTDAPSAVALADA